MTAEGTRPPGRAGSPGARPGRAHAGQAGVVALETALVLPVVALVLVAGLGLVGVVRTSLLAHRAAAVGARVAAVDDDAAVRRAVHDVAGPATVTVGGRPPRGVVRVDVAVEVTLLGIRRTLTAHASAAVEPVVGLWAAGPSP